MKRQRFGIDLGFTPRKIEKMRRINFILDPDFGIVSPAMMENIHKLVNATEALLRLGGDKQSLSWNFKGNSGSNHLHGIVELVEELPLTSCDPFGKPTMVMAVRDRVGIITIFEDIIDFDGRAISVESLATLISIEFNGD